MSNARRIPPDAERLFEVTLKKVQDQFEIRRKDPGIGIKLLAGFDELKKYNSVYVHKVTEFKGSTESFMILLIEKHQTIVIQKRNGAIRQEIEEIEPIMIFAVPHAMGRVLVQKETLADKITDVFTKVDIDFKDYPEFSKNYLVVGENPELVRQNFPQNLMAAMGDVKDLTIELNGNKGLLRTERNLTENTLLLLLSIGYKMNKAEYLG